MQQTHHTLEKVVLENSNNIYVLSAQITQLEVIQGAVAKLLERIEDIVHNGWNKDRGMAYLAIDEIQDTVRLIDMAFHPLFKEMSEGVNTLNIHADDLYEKVVKNKSEQSSKGTNGLDKNSMEGWNAFAMESNIKTFINEVGREPESFEEVLTYILGTVKKVVEKEEENKKADALTSTQKI
ncbi:hypothetical protein QH639_22100 [Lysinibacillus sp. 1 U-2021]|uniref:hypothetical protein n=1 Tax=Lysinibacillus sp. 1 U-2021 TaxID=3039426 RepID=UPI00247FE0C9|nr:hypothetical protein [Lysinibacillus sp. 1 U-2021]WGT38473.1 hypothetical protein QH639_22100 [Lysinibacillus sp. 1 U-2021]